MKKIFTFIVIAAMALNFSSCDDFLDINRNPNSPAQENMTTDMIFPAAELSVASVYGNYLRIVGGFFSQHYAHDFGTSNYLGYSRFDMYGNQSSGMYTNLYVKGLSNLKTVMALAEEESDYGTILAATVIRAFAYQLLVDAYGEVPYTEALDPSNTAPAYDDGSAVYDGIIAEIDAALANVTASSPVCQNFLFPGATADSWIKFANALKLKMYMRESSVKNVQSQLSSLIAQNNFPDGDVAYDCFAANETGKANPFYQEEFATYFGSNQVNIALNLSLLKVMNDDPRLPAYFSANGEGKYFGGVSGTNFGTSSSYKAAAFNRPNAKYDDPIVMISKAEVEFFLAEYEARYGSDDKAAAHYEAAVNASFKSAGVEGADAVLAAYPWNKADYKKIIGIQKWVALSNGSNFESWCELRRLGYPQMSSVAGDQIYNETTDAYDASLLEAGTLYTPLHYNTDVGAGKILQRFPYAESSTTRNANVPATKKNNIPVFWAE